MKLEGTIHPVEINFRENKSSTISKRLIKLFSAIGKALKNSFRFTSVKNKLTQMDDEMLKDLGLDRIDVNSKINYHYYWN